MRSTIRLALSLLLLASLSVTRLAWAWPTDPTVNVPVTSPTAGSQTISGQGIIPDGSGGTIVAWTDTRNGTSDIYAQHFNATGQPLWNPLGLAICAAANSQNAPVVVSDGAGGAIIAWSDFRSGTNYDVYAQRVNAAGAAQWLADGVVVNAFANNQLTTPGCMIADGSGGAIIAWQDFRNIATTAPDLFALRLNSAGAAVWTSTGVSVTLTANAQDSPRLVSDAAGGVIVAWTDSRTLGTTGIDIYAQRFDASGSPRWTANGIAVCTAANDQRLWSMIPDGAGGAILAWDDPRGATTDIYAQRISGNGAAQWGTNGTPVCTAGFEQYAPTMATDGSGGAIIAWFDYRGTNADIYAQRLDASGVPLWVAFGTPICTASGNQLTVNLISDGAGGAIMAWQDGRNVASISNIDIYGQRISGSGTIRWRTDGVPIANALGQQYSVFLESDGVGGAVAAFSDLRDLTNTRGYVQRIEPFGKLGNPEPVITSVLDIPNDQGGHVRLAWTPSYLDAASDPDLSAYDIYRSVPPNLAQQAVRSGAAIELRDGDAPPAGRPAYRFSSLGTQSFAWEFMNSVSATHFLSSYGSVQSTMSDSVAGSNPTTAFMVVARGSSDKYWMSAPASGYSVDNLPPHTPAPFTGQYAAGATKLHWDRNTEADLAGYRLYRGSSPAFVPSAANLVSAQPDTGYIDAAAAPYIYKLTAIDSHGNESPVATLTPTGTLGVGDDAAFTLAFAAPSPNPARGTTTLAFTLPQSGHVRLSVFDAAGRRVQTLHDGEMAAGEHRAAFALRDDAGRELSPGLYLVRLEAAGRVLTRRLASVR